MELYIASISEIGGREVNEDACNFLSTDESLCCVLSDGLGGHYGGDIASNIVVTHTLDCYSQAPECSKQKIESLLNESNNAIHRRQQDNPNLKDMCATAVVLIINTIHNLAIWGHIGDSRLYYFRKNKIIAQTHDHSVSQQMVDAGHLKPEELRTSSSRNKLLAALGTSKHLEMDIISDQVPIQDDDVFLLCSDGLWEYIEEKEMQQMLSASTSASQWLKTLEQCVLTRGQHKKQDNYSAVAIWCSNYVDDDTTHPRST